jgi:chemotaxis receptor (MCP) glutamine deamidase CheD
MEIAIVLLGLGLGACIGLLAADMRQRAHALAELEKEAATARKLAAGLHGAHNNIITQMQAMGDRVSSLEFAGRGSTMTQKVFK